MAASMSNYATCDGCKGVFAGAIGVRRHQAHVRENPGRNPVCIGTGVLEHTGAADLYPPGDDHDGGNPDFEHPDGASLDIDNDTEVRNQKKKKKGLIYLRINHR